MNTPADTPSTRPYLLRALHEWCSDNGFTPYLAVHVDHSVQVPMEFVKNNEIVLNVGFEATSGLKLGNETIEFRARFGGVPRDIVVPVDHVVAIYARENGQGMAFPVPPSIGQAAGGDSGGVSGAEKPPTTGPAAPRTGLHLASVEAGDGSADDERAPPAPGAADPSSVGEDPAPPTPPVPPPPPPRGGRRPSLKRVK